MNGVLRGESCLVRQRHFTSWNITPLTLEGISNLYINKRDRATRGASSARFAFRRRPAHRMSYTCHLSTFFFVLYHVSYPGIANPPMRSWSKASMHFRWNPLVGRGASRLFHVYTVQLRSAFRTFPALRWHRAAHTRLRTKFRMGSL